VNPAKKIITLSAG